MSRQNQFPPQAITKDVLAAAYAWIQEQPDYIQQLASSKNDLVSLYRRAMKNQAPMTNGAEDVSSSLFQNSLKELTEDLKQFTEPSVSETQIPSNVMLGAPIAANVAPTNVAAAPASSSNVYAAQAAQQFRNTQPTTGATANENGTVAGPLSTSLDPISLEMIREVKLALNLSHENEAIRMLLRLGYEKAKDILPTV